MRDRLRAEGCGARFDISHEINGIGGGGDGGEPRQTIYISCLSRGNLRGLFGGLLAEGLLNQWDGAKNGSGLIPCCLC